LREQGYSPTAAAIEAARTRLRPVLMTALRVVLGMMAADGACIRRGRRADAPLGRAVIGGLLWATLMTLFVVPAVYSTFSGHFKGKHQRDADSKQ